MRRDAEAQEVNLKDPVEAGRPLGCPLFLCTPGRARFTGEKATDSKPHSHLEGMGVYAMDIGGGPVEIPGDFRKGERDTRPETTILLEEALRCDNLRKT